MAEAEVETLQSLLNHATSPARFDEDWEYINKFCDRVNEELDGPQVAVKLLAHKVQSPQEREALFSIVTLEACVKNCGKKFHQEIGKFRFLNELIKVVSPKYLGKQTTTKVKERCIKVLFGWSTGLPQEVKIKEAYDMLKAQGIVKDDPLVTEADDKKGTFDPFPPPSPPPERKTNSIFQDADKSKLLAKLLKSKHPEDLQAANRLIKNMVKQDAEKTEKVSQRLSQLETVDNNVRLLNEMLAHYDSNSNTQADKEIMKELYDSLEKIRPNLFRLASETDEKDNDGLNKVLRANDDVMQAMSRYRRDVDLVTDENSTLSKTDSEKLRASEVSTLLDLGLDGITALPTTNGSGDMASVSLDDELAKLGINTAEEQAVNNPTSNESSTLSELDDLFHNSGLPSNSVMPGLSELANMAIPGLSGGMTPHQQPLYPMGGAMVPPGANYSSASLLSETFSQPAPLQLYSQMTTVAPSTSQKKALEDLDNLGKSLLQQSLPLENPIPVPSPAVKVPMNQMQKAPSNPSPVSSAISAQHSSMVDPGPGILQPQSATGRSTTHSNPGLSSMTNSLTSLPSSSASFSSTNHVQLPQTGTAPSGGQLVSPPGVKLLPLTDVFVTLESIQPGTTPPVTAYDKDNIKIMLHFAKDKPRDDVTVMVVSVMSLNTSAVKNFAFQAAVPKTMKVKLQPPSGKDLAAYNPIAPPPTITQVMLLANPNKEKVRLKYKVIYTAGSGPVSNVGEVDNFPIT